MSTLVASPPVVAVRPAPLGKAYRFEVRKLLTQRRSWLLLGACWLVPALLVAVISHQGALPVDTVFGRWMAATGWAGCLVVLAFCSSWVLPLLASLVAGEAFALEDRLGTWRHLLVTVRSARRVFVAKGLASITMVLLLWTGLLVSGAAGGLTASGNHPLVGLDGHLLGPGHAALAVLLAWVCALVPTLAFAGVGALGAVAFGRASTGLLLPALLALLMQLAQLLALPATVRVSLPNWGFVAWRGLLSDPVQNTPLVVGLLVSLAWAIVSAGLALVLFQRRDFTHLAHDGLGGRALLTAWLPLALLFAATTAVVTAATSAQGSGIDQPKLQASLATTFGHLYRLQSQELHRPDVTETQLRTTASCDKGGSLVSDVGAGNDWRCVVSWRIPGAVTTGSAVYQVDVSPDGRYVADGDGPQAVNGFFRVVAATGDAPNPLWQLDGSIDLLAPR